MKEVSRKVKAVAENNFYKIEPSDKIWWVESSDGMKDEFLFSFDKKKIYNLFNDYHKLSKKQKKLFDKENQFWHDFMNGKLKPLEN